MAPKITSGKTYIQACLYVGPACNFGTETN